MCVPNLPEIFRPVTRTHTHFFIWHKPFKSDVTRDKIKRNLAAFDTLDTFYFNFL